MMKIDFYGGVGEIGGNKIKVDGQDASFFFDFGMGFSVANDYLSEFLQPRKANGILDFLALGLLPCIKGIYREDYLRHTGLSYQEEPAVQGVLISHSHVDHAAYIHHLREDIPIYLTEESLLILKALEDTGAASFSEYTHLKKAFQFIPKKTGGYTRATRPDKVERDIRVINPYENFEIGDFKIKCAPVDHSLPGATGYIAENDDETLIYSGDLRFHGRKPHYTRKFVKEARKSHPTIMICEGTRIESNHNVSEEDIEKRAIETIKEFKGLVIINYPIRDLDRLLTFYRAAVCTDRKLVVSLKQAYILNLFNGGDYPKINDIAVYQPRKSWGLVGEDYYACYDDNWICSNDIEPEQVLRDYKVWERDYLDWDNTVNYSDLQENPQDYIFRCDFFELKELIDVKPEDAIYIKSSTEPFDEQMEINEEKVKNWLDLFNIPYFNNGFHASGHANGKEILEMIEEINPEKLYPVHTTQPEKFRILEDEGIKVVYPRLSSSL